jgi:hypothetical protein
MSEVNKLNPSEESSLREAWTEGRGTFQEEKEVDLDGCLAAQERGGTIMRNPDGKPQAEIMIGNHDGEPRRTTTRGRLRTEKIALLHQGPNHNP